MRKENFLVFLQEHFMVPFVCLFFQLHLPETHIMLKLGSTEWGCWRSSGKRNLHGNNIIFKHLFTEFIKPVRSKTRLQWGKASPAPVRIAQTSDSAALPKPPPFQPQNKTKLRVIYTKGSCDSLGGSPVFQICLHSWTFSLSTNR